ncbi:MAG TPA: shikimate kinase [Planctomycetes bacterium]|nr:shikimate kinase [Planctomycetota bacterium]HIL38424.1 shikimate kinase [Planctomycetota bacterium]
MSVPVLVLVGLRCVGKSTLGRGLARRLGWEFLDLDTELARRTGSNSAGALLAQVGLEEFRDREQEVLFAVLKENPVPRILATGGGVVEREENRVLLKSLPCVWLDTPVDILVARLEQDSVLRPSLTDHGAVQEFEQLHKRRAPWYEQVAGPAVELGGLEPDGALDLLCARVRERFGHFGEQ